MKLKRIHATLIFCVFGMVSPTKISAQRLTFEQCSTAIQAQIRDQFRWIRFNELSLINEIEIQNPTAFAGRAKERLNDFFKKHLTSIRCTDEPSLCTPSQEINGESTHMLIPHQYPLTMCINRPYTDSELLGVLAHHLGHHILLTKDQRNCEDRCRKPSLAQLMSRTAVLLREGQSFSLEHCLTLCAPPRQDSDVPVAPDASMPPSSPVPIAPVP